MNYQAKTILKTWPKRFKDLAAATPYARNPEKLANSVYGKRMGNKLPGDGWQFRGAGFIGITGRELYTKYAAFIKKDVIQTSDLMRTEDRYALDSACWFFADLKKLISVAKKGDFIAVVKGINGGTTGLSVRQKYYNAIKKVFSGE
jgi:putative chitinase